MVVDHTLETKSSVIAFGRRDVSVGESQPVVLKAIRREGDEWRSGEILKAFNGNGVARVYENAPGAVLLERLMPGTALAEMALSDRDAEATDILANVTEQMSMSARRTSKTINTVVGVWSEEQARMPALLKDWSRAFERYIQTGNDQVPKPLVEAAHQLYSNLCASQREPRLLHGDLQHYNVLFDSERGWLAIDPKGVVGEVEYEVGAMLRNPVELPELFTSPAIIKQRVNRFVDRLGLDYERVLGWGFAQAVLSAIWDIEDGLPVDAMNSALRLAQAIQPMLPSTWNMSTGKRRTSIRRPTKSHRICDEETND